MSNDFLAALEGAANRAKKRPKPAPKAKLAAIGADQPSPASKVDSKPSAPDPSPSTAPTPPARSSPAKKASRLTCYLFENDMRALSSIRERLESVGHDFVNRSDAIKVALRFAAKTKPEQLSKLLHDVKQEDLRFKTSRGGQRGSGGEGHE